MNLLPTILTKIFQSNEDASVAAIFEDASVISEHGTLIEHTILMKHEDYPDDSILVDVEGRRWALVDDSDSLQRERANKVNRLVLERNDANNAAAEQRAAFERQITELQRAFRDTFSTLAFGMPSKEEFNAWYDRNVRVVDDVIAAKRKASR